VLTEEDLHVGHTFCEFYCNILLHNIELKSTFLFFQSEQVIKLQLS